MGFITSAQIPQDAIAVDITVFPKEKPMLSINCNILLAGESLLYKISVLNDLNINSKLSKMGYVSLRNENDSVVFNHKLNLENGIAYSDFFLPSSLKTGIYRLIGYTNFSRNNKDNAYDEKNIYVINTFIKNGESRKVTDTIRLNAVSQKDPDFSAKNGNSIRIKTDRQSYGYRDKVTLSIENFSGNDRNNYTLSVRKINPVQISDQSPDPIQKGSSEIFYIPELRGELISGVVLSKADDSPVANKVVSLTIPGKDFIFKVAKTNINGRFFFSVSEGYSSEKSIVQLNEPEQSAANYRFVLDEKDFILGKTDLRVFKIDLELKSWLQDRSVQIQIENSYFDKKHDSILPESPSQPFYNNLGTVYKLDDYTRFPSVRETFVEIIKLAAVRGSEENTRFFVYNEYDPRGLGKFNDIPPLVLMDGFTIQNNSELLNYNANNIKSIRVINQPYRYGPKIYSGIIAIETVKNDFVLALSKDNIKEIDLFPIERGKMYFSPDYVNNTSLTRIPDYRVQLLWQPKVQILSEDYSNYFFTSDVPGIYEIRLEGFSDSGRREVIRNYFEVLGE